MELNSRFELIKIRENLQKVKPSVVMMSLNSKLSISDAMLVNQYSEWKKF